MSTFYLIGIPFEDDMDEVAYMLDASSMDDAMAEAMDLLVEAEVDGRDALNTRDLDQALVMESSNAQHIDLDAVAALADAARARTADAHAVWVTQIEELRDELGHWRTLFKRGKCPKAQVTLFEDRLTALVAAQP